MEIVHYNRHLKDMRSELQLQEQKMLKIHEFCSIKLSNKHYRNTLPKGVKPDNCEQYEELEIEKYLIRITKLADACVMFKNDVIALIMNIVEYNNGERYVIVSSFTTFMCRSCLRSTRRKRKMLVRQRGRAGYHRQHYQWNRQKILRKRKAAYRKLGCKTGSAATLKYHNVIAKSRNVIFSPLTLQWKAFLEFWSKVSVTHIRVTFFLRIWPSGTHNRAVWRPRNEWFARAYAPARVHQCCQYRRHKNSNFATAIFSIAKRDDLATRSYRH